MKRVYVREDVCMGCGLCRLHCLVEHSKTKNMIKAFKKETPRPLSRIRVERNGEVSFSLQCQHCDEPWCVYSCLTGAMHRDPTTGAVAVDPERCMGCWTCIVACPNGALSRDVSRKVVAKCDLCPGYDVPACVANCPNEALVLVEVGSGGQVVRN
ncbi:MAG: 4Fe-4S dicluster domain-containing protein [Chloroflexi bacterium]|nr:4Fe-4S dicluster domain-containing protein [Chloroflexota bacterium]